MKYAVSAERTAEILIQRHGRAAFDFAVRQCAAQEPASSEESMAEWQAIVAAVERLQPVEP